MPSPHDAGTHVPFAHVPDAQSEGSAQLLPSPLGPHVSPPQSVSVSLPFTTESVQLGCAAPPPPVAPPAVPCDPPIDVAELEAPPLPPPPLVSGLRSSIPRIALQPASAAAAPMARASRAVRHRTRVTRSTRAMVSGPRGQRLKVSHNRNPRRRYGRHRRAGRPPSPNPFPRERGKGSRLSRGTPSSVERWELTPFPRLRLRVGLMSRKRFHSGLWNPRAEARRARRSLGEEEE